MARAEASVEINRPIAEVFAFATDLPKMPEWSGEVIESRLTSEGPLGAGSTFTGVGRFLGRRIEVENEVTAFEPNARVVFKTISGPVKSENSFTFESLEGGTRVTEAIDLEAGGFFRVAEPLLARMIRRQFETNLANLKDLLEAELAS